MKIVDYNTFIKLPINTLYCTYEPCTFGEPCIKAQLLSDSDWFIQYLVSNPEYDCDISEVCDDMEKGISAKPDFEIMTRDGMYDYDRKFLIYDKEDIQLMINKLNTLL